MYDLQIFTARRLNSTRQLINIWRFLAKSKFTSRCSFFGDAMGAFVCEHAPARGKSFHHGANKYSQRTGKLFQRPRNEKFSARLIFTTWPRFATSLVGCVVLHALPISFNCYLASVMLSIFACWRVPARQIQIRPKSKVIHAEKGQLLSLCVSRLASSLSDKSASGQQWALAHTATGTCKQKSSRQQPEDNENPIGTHFFCVVFFVCSTFSHANVHKNTKVQLISERNVMSLELSTHLWFIEPFSQWIHSYFEYLGEFV